MLNNKKIFIYNLCFGLSKLYTYIQQDQKAKLKLSYVNVVCIYGGRGAGLEVLICFVRGGQIFFYLLCVCVCGGGGGGQVHYLSFRERNNRPPPINK